MHVPLQLGRLALVAVLVTITLTACRPAADTPQITHVRPSVAAPGSLVLVSGRGFERADIVWLNGEPAAQVTWVNAQLLTAVVPAGLAAGAYPLEVRSLDGERAAVSLNIGGPPATPAVAEAVPSSSPAAAPAGAVAVPPPVPPLSQPPPSTAARPQPSVPAAVSGGTTADQQKAEERQREAQKKAEEQQREAQKKAEERQREAEKKRQEDEKKRQEQPRR